MLPKITLLKKDFYLFVFLVFEDNPTEENQTIVERLVEETCRSSPTPIFIKKKKGQDLDFAGPTIQDSEGRIDPSKGKRKGKIPSGTEYTQGSAFSQRQVPEIHIISEPERKLSMSDSNRHNSHSEGSNRHLTEPEQAVLHSLQGQGLGNVSTNTPRSDELLEHLPKILKEEEILRYSNGWNPLSSKPQIKKIKEYHAKKRQETKEEAPVASTRKPQANPLPQ
ncbi:hypothetical protein O181_039590 [Austropuccinia psidii MF-1]|uniref:Uncharacterized protein n=1 Tax=Austropuccinia psidii MF-1 TaxID=1389203 RepID=A0A9Q3DBS8_9BASI|nr:hypothetical protein [Austropuccinia psidii MF-1]